MTRRFRDAVYVIRVRQTGVRSMRVDGEAVEGCTVPIRPGKTQYHVEVTV